MPKINVRCKECGFNCKMEFDIGETILPMRILDDASIPAIPCPFEVLFWPDPKPIWRMFGR